MYFVYIVKCSDETLYTGITSDLERRIREHNISKLGAKYTKMRRPVKLVYSKKFINRSEALREEARIKKLSRNKKLKIVTKISNKIHKQILKDFEKYKNSGDKKTNEWVQHYLGSNKPTLGIKTEEMIKMAKEIANNNKFNEKKLVELLNSLYGNASTFAEIDIAARLLGVLPIIRRRLKPEVLDYWLNFTHGWAETDLLCQSNFTAKELLSDWSGWKKILLKFQGDKNIHKRRASMVLLTKSLRESDDARLSKLAFSQVEKLKGEKEILITKAVSWLLRSLVKFHKEEVTKYLSENKNLLPKIAYREALAKVETGRKNRR